MLDVAYRILKESSEPVAFADLVEKVAGELGYSKQEKDAKMAQFYTNLTIDGRFVVLTDNKWDLRERVSYEMAHIDMNEAYNEVEEDDSAASDEKTEEFGEESEDENGEDFDNADAEEDRKADEFKKELGAVAKPVMNCR
jgi:DNA-directed RNA polymerase subunit delta